MTIETNDGRVVSYVLIGGADIGKFRINRRTGVVRFRSATDFQNPEDANGDNVYEVNVQVTDTEGGIDTQMLFVEILEPDGGVIDPPNITSNGGGDNAFVEINENTTFVTDTEATGGNGDTEGNGLTYRINAGPDLSLFDIAEDTGVVSFISAPNFENPLDDDANNTYRLNVLARNSDGQTDSQFLVVAVRDVSETVVNTPPVITSCGG